MGESDTTRLALRQWSAGTDTPSRAEFSASFLSIENNVAGFTKGTAAARPAAAAAVDRWLYWATDTLVLSMCDASSWRTIWSVGLEVVGIYADATARDAAITAPTEGQAAYLTGTNAWTVYDGSAWTVRFVWGTGSPEGAVTATVGALFMRTDGGVGSVLYVKEAGSGNTGWRVMSAAFGIYADATARDAVITAPTEGQQAYLTGSNAITYYDGSAWVIRDVWGAGSPEGVVTATVGAVYRRTDGGTGTTLYVKESGSGNTGWAAAGSSASGGFTIPFLVMGA